MIDFALRFSSKLEIFRERNLTAQAAAKLHVRDRPISRDAYLKLKSIRAWRSVCGGDERDLNGAHSGTLICCNSSIFNMPNGKSSPGPQHERFVTWAKKQGVEVNGVELANISGSGLGIIAQRKIEVSEKAVSNYLTLGLNVMLGWRRDSQGACFYSFDSQINPRAIQSTAQRYYSPWPPCLFSSFWWQ